MQKSDRCSLDHNTKQALSLKVYNFIFQGKEPVNSTSNVTGTRQILIFAPQRSLEKQLKRNERGYEAARDPKYPHRHLGKTKSQARNL